MAIEIQGVRIGAQDLGKQPEWVVSYSENGQNKTHRVRGENIQSSIDALRVTERDLGVSSK